MMTKENEKGLKESINGDNDGGGGGSLRRSKGLEATSDSGVVVVVTGGKENKVGGGGGPLLEKREPPRRVSLGEPVGLPSEHLLPQPPPKKSSITDPAGIEDSSAQQKNGLKRQNSGRQKCRCWCCCCSCSCLALKNAEPKGKEAESDFICDPDPPPNLEEIRSWGDSFDKLMRNGGGRKIFRDFLKCEYSEENILFWLACEELKKERVPEAIEEKARLIYEDYISILSPKEVSLDSRVRDVVNQNMRNPKPSTFDEAQLQIYTLMHRDSYPRFVNSPLYKKLAQLNSSPTGGGTPSGGVGPPIPGSHRGSIAPPISSPASRKQSAAS